MKFIDFLGDKSIETYFDEKLKICGSMDELPRELNNCTCCTRHKINFPVLCQRIVSNEYSPVFTPNECKCPCRHIARHICREWDTINQVDECETSEEESETGSDSSGSLKDFIVPDTMPKKARKRLDRVLNKFKSKRN